MCMYVRNITYTYIFTFNQVDDHDTKKGCRLIDENQDNLRHIITNLHYLHDCKRCSILIFYFPQYNTGIWTYMYHEYKKCQQDMLW